MKTTTNTKILLRLGDNKKRLDALAKKSGLSATALARMMVENGIENMEKGRIAYKPETIAIKED